MESLSDEQVAELKVGFLLYAQEGKIQAKELGTVMRYSDTTLSFMLIPSSLGLFPTNAELADMANDGERNIEFPEVCLPLRLALQWHNSLTFHFITGSMQFSHIDNQWMGFADSTE